MNRHPTWFSRWKRYPLSCLGHCAQGVIAGLLVSTGRLDAIVFAVLWAAAFWIYQGLSFARKVNQDGKGDTAGLDSVDFLVGMLCVVLPWAAYLIYQFYSTEVF